MSGQQKTKNGHLHFTQPEPLLTREELIAMIGLIVVSLGLVFAFGQASMLDYSSPWWTLFIGIPGLVFLAAGVLTFRHHRGHITSMAITQSGIGLVAALLALSFILDPDWSFTRDWTLFKGEFWNTAWRWLLVILGIGTIAIGFNRRSLETAIFGGIVGVVGLVFVLNISWDVVWPLAIVAVGVGILSLLFRKNQ